MITQAKTSSKACPATIAVRNVALCHIDPDKFALPAEGLPGVSGTNLVTAYRCAEAIEAALHGEVDVLVVDGDRVGLAGLNALSFLNQERPEVPIYIYQKEGNAPARLIAWRSLV